MIAKYNGKCDLTGTTIIAGETEIARVGKFTVLAEYGSAEAVESWFASQTAQVKEIAAEMAELRGRKNTLATMFEESLERRRSGYMANIKLDAEWVRNEVSGMIRRLETLRNQPA